MYNWCPHFLEFIDRFLWKLESGFVYHPIEGNWFHFCLSPLPHPPGGGLSLTVAYPKMNYVEYLKNYLF